MNNAQFRILYLYYLKLLLFYWLNFLKYYLYFQEDLLISEFWCLINIIIFGKIIQILMNINFIIEFFKFGSWYFSIILTYMKYFIFIFLFRISFCGTTFYLTIIIFTTYFVEYIFSLDLIYFYFWIHLKNFYYFAQIVFRFHPQK